MSSKTYRPLTAADTSFSEPDAALSGESAKPGKGQGSFVERSSVRNLNNAGRSAATALSAVGRRQTDDGSERPCRRRDRRSANSVRPFSESTDSHKAVEQVGFKRGPNEGPIGLDDPPVGSMFASADK